MPPAAAAAAPIAWSTIGIQVGIGFGISAVSYAVQNFVLKDKGTFGNSNERNFQANGTSTETYLPVIYGKAKIGINRVFIDTDPGNKDWLYIVGAFAHGTIKRVKKIYADDEIIAVYNEKKKKWVVDDEYTGLVNPIQINRGSDNAKHFSFVGDKFDTWSDDKRGRGIASVALALKSDNDKFPGGIPNITLLVEGNANIYDPREGTYKYTYNFALCYLDALRNKRYGDAVPDNEIDFDNFAAEANYCDEWIEGDPIEAATKCKPKIKSMDCKLEKSGVYKYKVCATSTWTYSEPDFAGQTVSSSTALSTVSQVTITSKRGRVSLTIAPSATNKENVDKFEVYRTKANGSTYYLAREIDYDSADTEQELTFIDNLADEDLGINKEYEGNGWGDDSAAGIPSIVATYTALASNLDVDKYYRYKIIYGDITGKYTQGGVRSKAIKTKKGKNFIRLNAIPTSDDNGIGVRVIYRTEGMDNATDDDDDNANYKYLYTIADNDETEEYLDSTADSSLGVAGGVDSNPYSFPTTCPSVATLTSGQQRRHTVNGIMDTSKTVLQKLEEMLMCAAAKSHFEGGKWRLDIKKPAVAEQITLNRDTVIGDWSFNLPGADVLCNYVKAAFINPKANYQTDYVVFPPKRNLNQYLIDDNRFENVKEIDLPYINDRRKAQIMAMIARGLARQGITATMKVKEELLKARVGSVVKAELDTPGWEGKKFWIDGFSVGMDSTNYVTLTEYNADAFDRQYLEADPPDDKDTNLPAANEPPEEVKNVVITEEQYLDNYTTNWRLKVTFTNPDSPFWSHSDVYVKRGANAEYTYSQKISRDNKGIFYIQPIEAFTTYYLQILSVSTLGVSMHLNNEDDIADDWEATVWEKRVTIDSPKWNDFGIELLGRGGNTGVAYGADFAFRWKPYGGSNNIGHQVLSSRNSLGVTKTTGFTYYVQIYHDYPASVVVNNIKISSSLAASYYTAETICRYTYIDNLENSKTLFAGILKTSPTGPITWNNKKYAVNTSVKNAQTYYNQYWGKGHPSIRVRVSVIDEYNQMSVASEETIFTNPRPLMQLEATNSITGAKQKINISLIDSLNRGGSILNTKSGAEVSWQHPDKEYDISHYYLKYFRIGSWLKSCAYTTTDLILVGNKVYLCSVAGTSTTTIPVGLTNGEANVNDGSTRWKDAAGFIADTFEDTGSSGYTTKLKSTERITVASETTPNTMIVPSLVNVNSSDDDVGNAYYTKEIKQLDPKYKYLVGVVPLDVFGKTKATETNGIYNYAWGWAQPGLTDDDDENEIQKPATPTFTGITASEILKETTTDMADGSTNTRLTLKCNVNSEADIASYNFSFVGLNKPDALLVSELPTDEEIATGVKTISGTNYTVSSFEYKVSSSPAATFMRGHLRSAETGWTYWAKVKAINTSGQESAYTAYTANTWASVGGDIQGITMYSSTGAYSATTVTVTQLSETIKIEVEIADPPKDLWGVKFAVKESAFLGTVSDTTGRNDRSSNKVAEIAAKAGKAVYYQSGNTGKNYYISIMPIDNSKNDATIEGVKSWKDANANPYIVNGIAHESLGTSFKKYKFSGAFTADTYRKVSWSTGQLKIKGQTGSPFNISANNTGNFTGTKVIYWLSTASTSFSVVDYDDFYTDAAYDNALALAWIEANSDTTQKAIIIPMTGDDFSISSSMISANAIAAGHIQVGSVDANKMNVAALNAITANMGTLTSGTIALPSGTPRIYIDGNSTPPRIKITKAGYHAGTEVDPDKLLFDSNYNYFKIQEYAVVDLTLPSGTISGEGMIIEEYDLGTIEFQNSGMLAFIDKGNNWMYQGYAVHRDTQRRWEEWEVVYNRTDPGGWIKFRRRIISVDGTGYAYSPWNIRVYWALLAQTLDEF